MPLIPAAGTLAAVGMEINVDYLGVRVIDLSGAVLGEHVESADFRGSDPATVIAPTVRAVLRGHRSARRRDPDGRQRAGHPRPGGPDVRPGRTGAQPRVAGDRRRQGVPTRTRPRPTWPIRLDNEATLGARAEADALRPSGVLSFLYLSGEVGVGGALVIDGVVFGGRHGWSGEIGHTVVDPNGPLCRCGATGLPRAVRRQGRADARRRHWTSTCRWRH